ncbi:hypothetical protein AWB67_07599 [Caballeronia terrestris]|uniref:Uncharacterized protein n=1 Tax=Caballeronia terrestris TaxID=1226301 RepID=A0A158L607_9BURK|nr:hypothetical protein AWB67_07599 [Caballeronia terrestris]
MQDAVARRNHVDVPEGLLRPVDEVEAVSIATVFDCAVFFERVGIEAAALDGQRVVDHELCRHDRVDQRGVTTLSRYRIAQAGEVDEGGLPENVVAHDARRKPRKVKFALAFDDLRKRCAQRDRGATAHEVLGEHTRRVRQLVVSAWLDCLDRDPRVEEIQLRAGQRFSVCSVHTVGKKMVLIRDRCRAFRSIIPFPGQRFASGSNCRFSGPV